MTPYHAAQRRDRRGQPGLAHRGAGRRAQRAGPALAGRDLDGRVQRPGLQLGHRRGDGGGERPDHGPRRLAAGRARCTSPPPRTRPSPTCGFGLEKWLYYFREIANLPVAPDPGDRDPVEAFMETGLAVIGTPDEAAEKIQALVDQSGGFGAFLFMAHNWADFAATRRSYELFARYVAPALPVAEHQPRRLHRLRPGPQGGVHRAGGGGRRRAHPPARPGEGHRQYPARDRGHDRAWPRKQKPRSRPCAR